MWENLSQVSPNIRRPHLAGNFALVEVGGRSYDTQRPPTVSVGVVE